MFRTIRIRTKLAAALAVPLVGLVGIAGYEAVGAADDADAVRTQVELARASLGPGSAITTLQNERNLASLGLLGLDEGVDLPVKDLAEARVETDEAIAALIAAVRGGSVELRAAFGPALGAFPELEAIREEIDSFSGPRDLSAYETAAKVFDRYTNVIDPLLQTSPRLATNLDDATLRNGVSLVGAAARQGEAAAQIVRWVLLSQVTDNASDPDAQREVLTWIERSEAAEAEMRLNMSGPLEVVRQGSIVTGAGSAFLEQANRFVAGAPAEVSTMLEAVDSTNADGSAADTAANLAARVLDVEARQSLDDAQWRERAFQGLAAAMVLAAAAVTYYAARSITRPLRSLREQADEMARVRLPASVQEILDTPVGQDVLLPAVEPIAVATRDEVAEVAEALNTVQTSALDLAVEQAVLRRNISDSFVNLGRRNQNLLNRQLDFITASSATRSSPTRSRVSSASTTWPLACAATPSRCWSSPVSSRHGSGPCPCGPPMWCAPRWARSRTTSGWWCATWTRGRSPGRPQPTWPTSWPS